MSLPISHKEFQQISQDVCGTRPIWGMLRANEYLETSHPLRTALAKKAKLKLEENGLYYLYTALMTKILNHGACFSELSESERATITEVNEKPTHTKMFVPQEALFQRRREMRRQQASTGYSRALSVSSRKSNTARREPLRTRGAVH